MPSNRGENKTVVAALTLDGIGPRLRFDGAMTTDRFVLYIRHCLAPTLRPGQVVIADNLKAHLVPAVRDAIAARGARFLPLPTYSPDFNPIEEAFSKVPEEYLDLATLCGDPGHVRDRIAVYKEIGVSYLNINVVGEEPMKIYEQVKAWAE